MSNDGNVRELCLSKRVKNYWHKSGTQLSLKVWARVSEDVNVLNWLKNKITRPIRKVKEVMIKSKTEKSKK